jgi:hypothetical protein
LIRLVLKRVGRQSERGIGMNGGRADKDGKRENHVSSKTLHSGEEKKPLYC